MDASHISSDEITGYQRAECVPKVNPIGFITGDKIAPTRPIPPNRSVRRIQNKYSNETVTHVGSASSIRANVIPLHLVICCGTANNSYTIIVIASDDVTRCRRVPTYNIARRRYMDPVDVIA
jgi:hypothetical protein